ncbi:MAG TPA: hypothetical protein VHE78_12520 [Gemmatimonadaceae bacterium]|nr:hypothetical protein [Gemmatimonadaceae bacterium]
MSDILYERTTAKGPVVRMRRVSITGERPVRAVLEVDRRSMSPRAAARGGNPPSLVTIEGESEPAVVASLLPTAQDDDAIDRLLAQSGER